MKQPTRIALMGVLLPAAATLSLALALALASPAVAGNGMGPGPGMRAGPVQMDFAALDGDGNGLVTLEELQARAEALFAEADSDGSGALDADELAARITAGIGERMAARAAAGENAPEGAGQGRRVIPDEKRIGWMVEGMIRHKDKDGDGLLSMAELQPATAQLERLIDRLDSDDDNAISQAEFDAAEQMRWQRMGARGGFLGGRP